MWGVEKVLSSKEKKIIILLCVKKIHGKFMLCRVLIFDTRQTIDFAMCQRKGTRKAWFCMDLPCVFFKPGVFVAAHDKVALCRVPNRKYMVNNETHGKFRFSGSDHADSLLSQTIM